MISSFTLPVVIKEGLYEILKSMLQINNPKPPVETLHATSLQGTDA